MVKLSDDAKGSLFVAFWGLIYLLEVRSLDFGTLGAPKAGFMPALIGCGLLVSCLTVFLQSFARPVTVKEGEGLSRKPICLIAALLVYPLILPRLGFFLSTAALLFTAFRIFNYKNRLWSAVAAVITTAVTYVVFEVWLKVLIFPKGFFD